MADQNKDTPQRQPGAEDADAAPPSVRLENGQLILSGRLLIDTIATLEPREQKAEAIDIAQVSHMDTAGAWYVVDLQRRMTGDTSQMPIHGADDMQSQLIEVVRTSMPPEDTGAVKPLSLTDRVEALGRKTASSARVGIELTSFLGQVIAALGNMVIHPRRLRLTSLVHHMQEVGWNAIPIVALMSFLIGVVLAFQGSVQLRQFGAEVFVVDLIAISVLRELGILLTAIIVAGRSGSAYTAAIGSMKMREEVDAMRTLGLDPIDILVVPRVLALVLMLPVLGLIADLSGLVGGAIMSWIELGVSPAVFQARLVSNTDVWHFLVGMIKAPFFAMIIGIIGCYEGLKVGGNAESLGRLTSTSVVLSIFMVIVADAIFSVVFALIGI
ncbi:phospholipid/cholesterol/gamma-HCH transport system permease protein [Roseovarius nanhaiticus]|uniref:Phospholipid/cholesterol/gamma-HCH transport system permease protein n=1 Tax=Roseovarius nanhaiticus TaxID=573024 RepID=A0A1N7GXG8_9RHOB|nr:ABC transporter permease [Roseovarius nanhaiticus]SEL20582.1 phospholipid/cholesterol/gamma-HCH transport system permease protein [Roseovarius nanhaiticus]SIS17293.1 phospholipid/cholesterol/gamma-HCH transport system permease protein [Roseovarius nanhaiticus]